MRVEDEKIDECKTSILLPGRKLRCWEQRIRVEGCVERAEQRASDELGSLNDPVIGQ